MAEHRHICRHRLGLFERTELSHLRDEFGVGLRIHRILRAHFRDEQFQEIILIQGRFVNAFRRIGDVGADGWIVKNGGNRCHN